MPPNAPLRCCSYPGCNTLVSAGRCAAHGMKHREASPGRNLYATPRWLRERREFLRQHPFCECDSCRDSGVVKVATVVDHRVPHRGDERLFWDQTNWRALTKTHHDRKTAGETNARRREWREVEG